MQIVNIIALIAFAFLMVGIGIYSNRKSKSLDTFLLGGRNVGPWMSAFAYGTTYFSAVIFIGYAGKNGWDIGFGSLWIGLGNAVIGCFLAWKLLAKRTRDMTHELGSRTMPEFFEARYGSRFMKIYSTIIIFIFLMPYAASVYKGLGTLFGAIFPQIKDVVGIDAATACMIIVAVLTAVYLVLGGYIATAISDFIQGIIMLGGVIIMCIALPNMAPGVGGFAGAFEALKGLNEHHFDIFGGMNWNFLALNILLTSFGVWGMPQMVHKYYAIKDNKSISIATIVSTMFAVIIGCGAYFIGSFGRLFLNNTLPEGGYDAIVPTMLVSAFGGENIFGNILLALVLLCVLSASMSTLSGLVLTSSSAISVDLLQTIKPNTDKKKQMIFTRILCFVFIILSFIFASFNFTVIVSIMSYSWGVVAGAFIGPFIWGLYWKKVTKQGATAGLISSILVVGGFVLFGLAEGKTFAEISVNAPMFGVASMAASFVIVPLVSLFTQKSKAVA